MNLTLLGHHQATLFRVVIDYLIIINSRQEIFWMNHSGQFQFSFRNFVAFANLISLLNLLTT